MFDEVYDPSMRLKRKLKMSNQLEERVSALEKELSELRRNLEIWKLQKPWWEKVSGTFEGDESYKEAMKLGGDYRQSVGSNHTETE